MNKYYVLNNSKDTSLYYTNNHHDSKTIDESKRFINRHSAEKFLKVNNLSENYHIKLVSSNPRRLSESSIKNTNDIKADIQDAIDDTKDMIDTTLELLSMYSEDSAVNEEVLSNSNIEDVLDRLRKVQKYMSGITFYPTFDNSKSSISEPLQGNASVESDGDQDA